MQPWTFAYAADIHVGTPRSYRFQPAWNENWWTARGQIVDLAPEFLIVGGDLTRDGATHRFELEQVRADFDAMPFPVHAIPGNHETGNKWSADSSVRIQREYVDLYASVFGPSWWSFEHRGVRFSGIDPFLLGSGLAEEGALAAWLGEQAARPRAAHHVWFMHAALFIEDLHEPNWDVATHRNEWYFGMDEPHRTRLMDGFKASGATMVVTAHIHCRRRVRAAGIEFIYAPGVAFGQWANRWPDGDASLGFLECVVTDTGIDPRFVPLTHAAAADSYGPGGNPPLAGRDYTLALEHPPLDPDEQRFPRQ